MKKGIQLSLAAFTLFMLSCQPRTESRAHMDDTGERMSDSITNLIDSCLALPAKELAQTGSPIASSASSFSNTTHSK